MNSLRKEVRLSSGLVIQLVLGDLTAENTGAIVNAANPFLQHGGGVAEAIARRGGPVIQQESNAWVTAHGPVSHGKPAWTSAGKLPASYVIHAVGPVWGEGEEEHKLAAAVTGALIAAEELHLDSLALPAISTGIFGFPRYLAAKVILISLKEYMEGHSSSLKVVKVVIYDEGMVKTFEKAWHDYIGS